MNDRHELRFQTVDATDWPNLSAGVCEALRGLAAVVAFNLAHHRQLVPVGVAQMLNPYNDAAGCATSNLRAETKLKEEVAWPP